MAGIQYSNDFLGPAAGSQLKPVPNLDHHPALPIAWATAKPCAFLALVEIIANPDGGIPSELLRRLYRLSEQGRIGLALQQVTPCAVDLVLDDIVHELPLTIPGLLYIDAENAAFLAEAARTAEIVMISTVGFLTRLASLGVKPRVLVRTAPALDLSLAAAFAKSFNDRNLGVDLRE